MERFAVGGLRDLFAATEAVGDDDRVARRFAHGGKEDAFADAHRQLVFLFLESERAGHAAAAGVGMIDVESELLQHFFLVVEMEDGFVVAVRLNQSFAGQLRKIDFFFEQTEGDQAREKIKESVAVSHQIQQEDIDICEEVQRGLNSRSFDTGRYSVRREAAVHAFHRLLARHLRAAV